MKRMRTFIIISFSLTLVFSSVLAKPYYFYRDFDYGSSSQFNPISVFFNNSFDIYRSYSYGSNLFETDYRNGAINLWDNMKSPLQSIQQRGTKGFLHHEVYPETLQPRYGQFVPNWFHHLLGEGMLSRQLEEYYDAQGMPLPRLWGTLTVIVTQVGNEIVENGSYQGGNVDPISDIYIFNSAGILLFYLDGTSDFFSNTLQMTYWPHQPTIDLTSGVLINNGENYALKIPLGKFTRWKIFGYFGIETFMGVSIPITKKDTLSLGPGWRNLELVAEQKRNNHRILVPGETQNFGAGFFWDRNGSLMASFITTGVDNPLVQANFYPGTLFKATPWLGFFILASKWDGVSGGVTFRSAPVSIGLATPRDQSREYL